VQNKVHIAQEHLAHEAGALKGDEGPGSFLDLPAHDYLASLIRGALLFGSPRRAVVPVNREEDQTTWPYYPFALSHPSEMHLRGQMSQHRDGIEHIQLAG
jgi:hypothetical protein